MGYPNVFTAHIPSKSINGGSRHIVGHFFERAGSEGLGFEHRSSRPSGLARLVDSGCLRRELFLIDQSLGPNLPGGFEILPGEFAGMKQQELMLWEEPG